MKQPAEQLGKKPDWRNGALGDGDRLLFVGGPPRSGTTLAHNVLDSHSDILGTPELLHLPDLLHVRSLFLNSVDEKLLEFFCDRPDVDRAMYEFIDRILGPVVAASDACYVSEKTPSNVLIFRDLHELFPGARFVFVIRDPRAIVSSMLAVGERARAKGEGAPGFTRDVRVAVQSVRQHLEAGFDFARSAPDRCFILRFEDLTTRPEEVTRELCDFLRLDWSASMLRPDMVSHTSENALTKTGVWYDQAMFNRKPDPTRIDAWTDKLAPGHQVLVTRAFGHNGGLRGAGYKLKLDHLRGARRLAARASWARAAAGYRVRRALGLS